MTKDFHSDTLHIYGQRAPHASVRIVGSRESLLNLAALIQETTENNKSRRGSRDFFTNDGEQFTVLAHWESDQRLDVLHSTYSDKFYASDD